VETPIGTANVEIYANQMVLIPILRAGIGMTDGILSLIPTARVGHIGIFRNEDTLQPTTYFFKVPKGVETMDIILIDPMLATGGSAIAAIDKLKSLGCKYIKFLCLVAAPEGIKKLTTTHPDIPVYTAVIDHRLNEKGYIVP
jgi:uracil phosphoribosyltransferase